MKKNHPEKRPKKTKVGLKNQFVNIFWSIRLDHLSEHASFTEKKKLGPKHLWKLRYEFFASVTGLARAFL
jgi:hypothetical protein